VLSSFESILSQTYSQVTKKSLVVNEKIHEHEAQAGFFGLFDSFSCEIGFYEIFNDKKLGN
jgi:hypothetical protein